MNLDFSDEVKLLRDEAQKFLAERSPTRIVRRVLDGQASFDSALWKEIAELGWLGAAVPEEFGGAGLGHEGLCVLAEQMGAALAPVPFSSTVYFAIEAFLLAGTQAQKQAYLPRLADGSLIGTFALAEGFGNPAPTRVKATVRRGRLNGVKTPVAEGEIAHLAVVVAKNDGGDIGLYLADLKQAGVRRERLEMIDPTRNHAQLVFEDAEVEPLGASGDGWPVVEHLLDRAAILISFEQVGGAQACLDMARNYAMERYAFGRPIGSFQAIKHKLAHIFVAVELARSNAYYGAWAISKDSAELPVAAAIARVSAIEAYALASKENIQTHGGMGFTWESDCHLYFRRAELLALAVGSAPYWKERLVAGIESREAA